jgi:hypothetical protein
MRFSTIIILHGSRPFFNQNPPQVLQTQAAAAPGAGVGRFILLDMISLKKASITALL